MNGHGNNSSNSNEHSVIKNTSESPSLPPSAAPILIGTASFPANASIHNILITGGAGFIASWVTRHLTLTYGSSYNIIVYDKLDYCATLNNLQCLTNCANFRFVYGDITDQQAVLRCLRQHKIDTILHFAAMSHVDLSFGNSFEFTRTNTMGTQIMLESAVKLGVRKFIHVSTDEVNGETNHGDPDLLEESILAPTNPYAASKAAAEMYVNAYSKSYRLPCIIVRSNNVYGPNQYPEKVIPKFACLLDRARPLFLHGSGKNTRRYLYASDAADAFDTILHKGVNGEIYNVDSADEVANVDLAHRMIAMFGLEDPSEIKSSSPGTTTGNKWIIHTKDRPFNDLRYAVDATKLKNLGWNQKVRFEEGLARTVNWYRKFGKTWWGDEVDAVLRAFPEVKDGEVVDTSNDMPQESDKQIQATNYLKEVDDATMEDVVQANPSKRSVSVSWTKNSRTQGSPVSEFPAPPPPSPYQQHHRHHHQHHRSHSQPRIQAGNTFRPRSDSSGLDDISTENSAEQRDAHTKNPSLPPIGVFTKRGLSSIASNNNTDSSEPGLSLGSNTIHNTKKRSRDGREQFSLSGNYGKERCEKAAAGGGGGGGGGTDDDPEKENDAKRLHYGLGEDVEIVIQNNDHEIR